MASASIAGLSLHRKVIVKPLIINTVVTSFQGGRPHSRRRSGTSWVPDDAVCNSICSREKVVAEVTYTCSCNPYYLELTKDRTKHD